MWEKIRSFFFGHIKYPEPIIDNRYCQFYACAAWFLKNSECVARIPGEYVVDRVYIHKHIDKGGPRGFISFNDKERCAVKTVRINGADTIVVFAISGYDFSANFTKRGELKRKPLCSAQIVVHGRRYYDSLSKLEK